MGPQHVVNGWTVQETGPEHPDHKVLLLPGALATARFYDDLVAEPAVSAIGFAVSTLPGFGGTAPLDGADMATYASSATRLARELRCDAVVGHSLGANVALEMAGAGLFTGPMLLLSPSFSRKDESKFPRTLDRLGTVLGPLPYAAMLHIIGPAMKGSMLPADRRPTLVAELKKNDPKFLRDQTHRYLAYLDEHGSLASRLCDAGVPTWIVFGEKDDIGLRPEERRILEGCDHVHLETIPNTDHFTLNEAPRRVAELVLDMLGLATVAT